MGDEAVCFFPLYLCDELSDDDDVQLQIVFMVSQLQCGDGAAGEMEEEGKAS